MIKRTVGIESDAYLSLELAQLVIRREGMANATVPIEDLGILVVDYARTTLTGPLMAKLADEGVVVVFCDHRHMPCSVTVPMAAHHLHQGVLRSQVAQSEPSKKRLWQQVVQAKISAQAALAKQRGENPQALLKLQSNVLSGDTANVEGRAASIYFSQVFGPGFLRDVDEPGFQVY